MSDEISKRLNHKKERDATGSIRGFDWQRWLSLEAWLDLTQDETLWLEIGEDFAVESTEGVIASQAKAVRGGVSLNTETSRKFINTAYSTTYDIRYFYLSTERVAKEQDNKTQVAGIELWNIAETDDRACLDIANYLSGKSGINQAVREKFKSDDIAILRPLLSKIKWVVGNEDFEDVRSRVISKTTSLIKVHLGTNAESLAEEFAKNLFADLAIISNYDDTRKRKLTRAQLIEKIQSIYTKHINANTPNVISSYIDAQARRATSQELVDANVRSRLDIIKKCRVLRGYEVEQQALTLISEIQEGSLSNVTTSLKSEVFSKLAIYLAYRDATISESILAKLDNSSNLLTCSDYRIAKAHIQAVQSKNFDAVSKINATSPEFATARLCMAKNLKSGAELLTWIDEAQIGIKTLCSYGRHVLLSIWLENMHWGSIEDSLNIITDSDIIECPVLNLDIGLSKLYLAMPIERRDPAIRNLYLVHPRSLAFHETKEARKSLIEASEHFKQFSNFCTCACQQEFANLSLTFSVISLLANTNTFNDGIALLKQYFNNEETSLCFLPLAFDQNFDIKIPEIERLIKLEFASTNNKSVSAAFAWFCIAINEKNPLQAYQRLQQYRNILTNIIMPEAIISIEIEALANVGDFEEALKKLEVLESINGSEKVVEKLKYIVETLKMGEVPIVFDGQTDDQILNAKSNIERSRKLGDFVQAADQAKVLFEAHKTNHNLKLLCDIFKQL